MARIGFPAGAVRLRWVASALIAFTTLLGAAAAVPAAAVPHAAAAPITFPPRASAPWPSMRHDRHNTGRSTIVGAYRGGRPWSFRTGRGLFITPIVAGDGAVYFGSADHNFYALNPSGALRWKFTTGNIIDAAGALSPSQRSVTIGSADENLYQLSTNPRRLPRAGRILWRYHAHLPPASGQLVDW